MCVRVCCRNCKENISMEAFAYITIKCANGKKIQNGCVEVKHDFQCVAIHQINKKIDIERKRMRMSAAPKKKKEKKKERSMSRNDMLVGENAFYQNAFAVLMDLFSLSRWGRFFCCNAFWETSTHCTTCHTLYSHIHTHTYSIHISS